MRTSAWPTWTGKSSRPTWTTTGSGGSGRSGSGTHGVARGGQADDALVVRNLTFGRKALGCHAGSLSSPVPDTARGSDMREELVVRARGITKCFGDVVAVDGVDLDVAEGQVHGLVGPNGAGKTTLLG